RAAATAHRTAVRLGCDAGRRTGPRPWSGTMTGSRRTLRLMPPRRPANMLATLLGSTLLGGCTRQEEPAAPPPTPVRIAAVTAGPASPPIEATGFVAARDEQRLSFKVGGMVQQVR